MAEISEREQFIMSKINDPSTSDTDKTAFRAEYDAIQQQKADQAAVETKVAEAQAQVTQSFESITVGDQTVTLSELAANETARQILTIYFTQYVTALTAKNEQDKATLKSNYEAQITGKQQQYDALYETSDEQRKKMLQLQSDLDDMTAKRDAAAQQLDEAKAEIAQLRTEIASGTKAATVITNLDGDKLGDMIKQFNASKPAIYDVQPLDNLRKRFTAKIAETGEPIEYGYLESGKYRQVTDEEAAVIADRFRAEQDQQNNTTMAQDDTPDNALVTPPALQFPDSDTAARLATDTTISQGDATYVTRAEFESLKADVEALKAANANGEAA